MKIAILIGIIVLLFLMGKAYYDSYSIEIKYYTLLGSGAVHYEGSNSASREASSAVSRESASGKGLNSVNRNIASRGSVSDVSSSSSYALPLAPHASLPQSSVLSPQSFSSLSEALNGLKVAHLSDLHIGKIGLRERKVLEILKDEKPDVIFITGDLISHKGPYEPVLSFLDTVKAPLGVFAVLGNTDYSNENGSCVLCHEGKSSLLRKGPGTIFLRNSIYPLRIGERTVDIIGVDDPVSKKDDLKGTVKDRGRNPSILLAHSPEIFEKASNLDVDLLLCGHTHGGQVIGTKILSKIMPLIDPALEFLSGFFQKGKMLMYVSRGIGTSFLPFRLGVKPEITFFRFGTGPDRGGPVHQDAILNSPPKTVFAGLDLSSFIDTFNVLKGWGPSKSEMNGDSDVLFDFESEKDLERLDWQCHKWFEISERFATSGRRSLKAVLPPGQYPGIYFNGVKEDWSRSRSFNLDVGNPEAATVKFHVRIDDDKSGWEYPNRFDADFDLKPGLNHVSIPTDSIRTNLRHTPLNLKGIKRLMVFIPNNLRKREIYLDNIRLN